MLPHRSLHGGIPVAAPCLALALLLFAPRASRAIAPPVPTPYAGPFLQVKDQQLFLGKVPFHNIGVTIPDLFDRFLHGDDASAARALQDAATEGALFVRAPGISSSAADLAVFDRSQQTWFAAFDRMLAAVAAAHLTLVPSLLYDRQILVDHARSSGDSAASVADLYRQGTAPNLFAMRYLQTVVSRYRLDSRILFWEIGSDLNAGADKGGASGFTSDSVAAFLKQAAAAIRSEDHRHLICSGDGDLPPDAYGRYEALRSGAPLPAGEEALDTFAQYAQMFSLLNPAGIDIASTQVRPPVEERRWLVSMPDHSLETPWIQLAAAMAHKPLFVASFGQPVRSQTGEVAAPWMLDFMRRMQAEGSPLSAIMSWEPGPGAGSAPTMAMSVAGTPRMVVALKVANAVIANAVARSITIPVGPPLAATDQAVELDRLRTLTLQLHAASAALMSKRRVLLGHSLGGATNETGVVIVTPGQEEPWFTVRDAALMLGSDFVASNELAGWVKLIASRENGAAALQVAAGRTVPPYAIPDRILPDGSAAWFPAQTSAEQKQPPAGSAFFFLRIVSYYMTALGRPSEFTAPFNASWGRSTLAAICSRAFNSVAADPKSGLVVGDSGSPRPDWGYSASTLKTGLLLMPSLLRYEAALDLAKMADAAGQDDAATAYQNTAAQIKASLSGAFYLPLAEAGGKPAGMLLSATVTGRKEDVWAEAFAVWLHALPPDTEAAVAWHLADECKLPGGVVSNGMVRALPPSGPYGGTWEQSAAAPGTAENGGYWAIPVGWLVTAVEEVDASEAVSILTAFSDAVSKGVKQGAPYEWVNADQTITHGPLYAASLAQPSSALEQAFPQP